MAKFNCGHKPHFARGRCKPCYNRWYYESRTRRDYQRQYYLANRARRFQKVYGITLERYDEMFEQQDGKCAICETRPSGNERWGQLAVDHIDTANGPRVRGLLCLPCNSMLGMARDDINILHNAVTYLRGKTRPVFLAFDAVAR